MLLVKGPRKYGFIGFSKEPVLTIQKGLKIVRNLIGHYITSLEMQGCSITLLKLDDELMKFWDRSVKTVALRWGI